MHQASIGIQELIEQDIECPSNCSKLKEILNQQKEFIKYLEDNYKEMQDIWYIKILQKYKEIIGGKDEDI